MKLKRNKRFNVDICKKLMIADLTIEIDHERKL